MRPGNFNERARNFSPIYKLFYVLMLQYNIYTSLTGEKHNAICRLKRARDKKKS